MKTIDMVSIGIAGFALILSGIAILQTYMFNKKQHSLIESQKKLNSLILEKENEDILKRNKADLGASFIKLGSSKYRLKIWNKGTATARNVKIEFPEGNNLIIEQDLVEKFPMETLEKYQSVELIAAVSASTKPKLTVLLVWEDDSQPHNEKLVYPTL